MSFHSNVFVNCPFDPSYQLLLRPLLFTIVCLGFHDSRARLHRQPVYIFPQHFGTYQQTGDNAFWTRGYPDELKERLSSDLQKRYNNLIRARCFGFNKL